MIKIKSIAIPRFSLIILLAAVSAYTILVFPKDFSREVSSTLVFESSIIQVKAITVPTTKAVVQPKVTPIPFPVMPPNVLYSIAPIYPKQARAKGVEGMVIVKALISEDGRLLETNVKTSSGSSILDSSAVSSLNFFLLPI